MANFYIVNTHSVPVVRSYLVEEVNPDGSTTTKVYEEQITRIMPFAPTVQPAFNWSAVYSEDQKVCLVRTEAEMPSEWYVVQLTQDADFTTWKNQYPELFIIEADGQMRKTFEDLPDVVMS